MIYNNLNEILTAQGGSVIEKITYDSLNESDIEGIIKKVNRKENYDSIFVISSASDLAKIMTEFRKNKIDKPTYGPLWAHTDDLLRIGGKSVEGLYVVSGLDKDNNSVEFTEFKDEYYKRYGTEVNFSSVYSYETILALSLAIEESDTDTIDPQSIKNKIIEIGTFQGLEGDFIIDKYGDNSRKYLLDQITDGNYIRVDENEN